MRYRLYDNADNDTSNILEGVLKNRGIEDCNKYLNLDGSVVIPYQCLDNIDDAVRLFMGHFNDGDAMGILVDSDPDGYCSSAMMYSYIKQMDRDYPVTYIMHAKAKAHGLSDDVSVPEDIKLLIIPDAGTNDTDQCKALSEKGVDVLILDHHDMEQENPYAVIVNNQSSKGYMNKDLCGAGVVYHFLQALDDENWDEFADGYLDLLALANISDVMDMRSYETRYLTDLGLLNISNKCFQALIKAQDYSMNGKVNIHNIQWYVTTILNGCIRFGSQEEKDLLFRAFIGEDEFFEYKKRATKDKPSEVIQESIYDRAARLCKNAKSRQDKQREKCVSQIADIVSNYPDDNKVIMADVSDILDSSLTGVVAVKIAEMFHKPCILLRRYFDEGTGSFVYNGSARNIRNSPIDDFKEVVNSTGIFKGIGHPNAFGVNGLEVGKESEALSKLNYILQDIEYDSTYKVDFILGIDEVNVGLVTEMSRFEDVIGQGIDEPMVAVENIALARDQFEIFGKNEDTLSFNIDGVKYIQFRCKEGNALYDWVQDAWNDDDYVEFNLVGKPSVNEYNGIRILQVIIEDVDVIKISNNTDDEW